jgi:hypothetical protein
VYVSGGNFTMSGGEISGNTARSNGDALYKHSGTVTTNTGISDTTDSTF